MNIRLASGSGWDRGRGQNSSPLELLKCDGPERGSFRLVSNFAGVESEALEETRGRGRKKEKTYAGSFACPLPAARETLKAGGGGRGPREATFAGFGKPSRDENMKELLEFPALSAWI